MEITKIERFKVLDKEFPTPEGAMDHVEDRIHRHVQAMLDESGALARSSIKAAEYILKHRKELAMLLSIQPYKEDDDENR